jgi:hypothetical protein
MNHFTDEKVVIPAADLNFVTDRGGNLTELAIPRLLPRRRLYTALLHLGDVTADMGADFEVLLNSELIFWNNGEPVLRLPASFNSYTAAPEYKVGFLGTMPNIARGVSADPPSPSQDAMLISRNNRALAWIQPLHLNLQADTISWRLQSGVTSDIYTSASDVLVYMGVLSEHVE